MEVFSSLFQDPQSITRCGLGQDFARDWTDLRGWSCQRFARTFPHGRMRAEYAEDDFNSDIRMSETKWLQRPRKITQDMQPPSSAYHHTKPGWHAPPRHAPYIWHVKNHRDAQRSVCPLVRPPYFASNGDAKAAFKAMNHSLEFWFGLEGSGALAHGDGYCRTVVPYFTYPLTPGYCRTVVHNRTVLCITEAAWL